MLSELNETVWSEMLNEAYNCLNADKNYRGSSTQSVTLKASGKKVQMRVSPHLNIGTDVWPSVPMSEEDAKSKLQEAIHFLVWLNFNFSTLNFEYSKKPRVLRDFVLNLELNRASKTV